ncbi:trihelix transcription factor DF1-like [Mercurialis annua]|uniref:trihelix transcription factor DF1-like n=1 Tax=Mercurialis annua TaxID=3986 RepID=UPI00216107F8|nr:trihelix transcription factor DF1-like [Mercurialis annua]
MLGDSSSVLATTTTASTGGGGGGGGGGGADSAAPPHQLTGSGCGGTAVQEFGILREGGHNSGTEDDKRGGGGDDGDRSFGGNRWPRQETLALLKIRSDMDVAFRDSSVKGPLWDEVSRKLAELGYNRSAKKCKEKFENVFKYHKRTKEGRTGKQEGKTYRFFDQLEAFESHTLSQQPLLQQTQTHPPQHPQPPQPQILPLKPSQPPPGTTTIAMPPMVAHPVITTTVSSISSFPSSASPTVLPLQQAITVPIPNPSTNLNQTAQAVNMMQSSNFPSFSADLLSNSTSSSTSSDVEIHQGRRSRKRKWKDFFEKLMTEVIHKQEDMQKQFLEAIEKREHDRMVREESWRIQEMARINREREILAQERSIAAAKDSAVMAFLQKLSEQQNPGLQQPQTNPSPPPQQQPVHPPLPPPPTQPQPQPMPAPVPQALPVAAVAAQPAQPAPPAPTTQQQQPAAAINLEMKSDNGDRSLTAASSSRWPKVEVHALINLRGTLDSKYQENGPKGPLWEEISAGMKKLGYNRNSKRCKEKWENINKYFKKVKESNKKRPQDSKTCPYFHQLDALYREKHKNFDSSPSNIQTMKPHDHHHQPHQINSVPLMVRPEQQWPPLPNSQQQQQHDSVMEDLESDDNLNDDDDKDMDEDEEDEASGYEIVANSNNRPTSMSSAG